MNKIFFSFFLLFSSFLSGEKVILTSYPGSGSHWFMYATQTFTHDVWHAPTRDLNLTGYASRDTSTFFRGHTIVNGEAITNNHGRTFQFNKEKDTLILILRNYKDVFLRKKQNFSLNEKTKKEISLFFNGYYKLIELFESWDTERKILLYYDELIDPACSFLYRIAHLIDAERDSIEKFVEQRRAHEELCKHALRTMHHFKLPSGKDTQYYTRKHSKHVLQYLDTLAEKKAPLLFHKYLHRFQQVHL